MDVPLSAVRNTRNEMNCSVAKSALAHAERVCTPDAVKRIVAAAGVPRSYLEDGSNWISFACFNRILEALVQETGDADAPFKAGLAASDPAVFGWLRVLATQFLSVKSVFRLAVKHHRTYSKISNARLRRLNSRHAVIEMTYIDGFEQTELNCKSIRGHWAMVPCLFGLKPAKVNHSECLVYGGKACVYEVSWTGEAFRCYAPRTALMALAAGGCLALMGAYPLSAWISIPLLTVLGYALGHARDLRMTLKAALQHKAQEASALMESVRKIEELNGALQGRVEERTRELSDANAALEQAMVGLEQSREKALAAERQATVGVLASGMAHEINSPVNAIRLSAQALLEDAGQDSPFHPLLQNIVRATTRCKRIVDELLSFSRESRQIAPIDVEQIVDMAIGLFAREVGGDCLVDRFIEPNLPKMTLDRSQIQQAILNLLTNAFDAGNGKAAIEVRLYLQGQYLIIAVHDDGPGMSEEVLQRAFDPFFTTKSDGKGTGLGLAITCRLVQRNGGTLEVDSKVGEGTTFLLRFPVTDNEPPAEELRRKPKGSQTHA